MLGTSLSLLGYWRLASVRFVVVGLPLPQLPFQFWAAVSVCWPCAHWLSVLRLVVS